MPQSHPPRQLLFEQLEQKLSPTSLLLVLAPLPEEQQREIESWITSESSLRQPAMAWKYHHDTQELLQFIENHTGDSSDSPPDAGRPTMIESEAADTWLRLDDTPARDAVIAELPQWKLQR